ncbi:hypothetical protein CTI12_AA479240 [Artemisia annua]|uniref:Uncharacterized protein n=1 Tax=Artemisia annua TaxID=35608 RepID=A0A2U1LJQ1_ARTAN|nr:hypothetical protein CTI12_AA479240 [Artemisia annua]
MEFITPVTGFSAGMLSRVWLVSQHQKNDDTSTEAGVAQILNKSRFVAGNMTRKAITYLKLSTWLQNSEQQQSLRACSEAKKKYADFHHL